MGQLKNKKIAEQEQLDQEFGEYVRECELKEEFMNRLATAAVKFATQHHNHFLDFLIDYDKELAGYFAVKIVQ